MFTGLIEEIGTVKNVKTSAQGCVLTVACSKILEQVKLGDSISVNGVCQTVVSFGADYFITELSNETLSKSNFDRIKSGDSLNLERALTMDKRLDGHLVNGHVDSTAKFLAFKNDGFSYIFTFELDEEYIKYIVSKGCIGVNGVSLTVSNVDDHTFSVAVIPTTYKETNLSSLIPGDFVNIEVDIIAKYVEKMLFIKNNTGKIDVSFLEMNGFV